MSKKIIRFSKGFVPFIILSLVIIVLGVVGVFTKGFNFGLDFEAGLIQEVKIAPTAIEMIYTGAANVAVETTNVSLSAVISGAGAENETVTFLYADYSTIGKLVVALNTIDGMVATSNLAASTSPIGMFSSSSETNVLSSVPVKLYTTEGSDAVSIDQVRNALSGIESVSVKSVGEKSENAFQIRIKDEGSDSQASKTKQELLSSALIAEFGEGNVAVLKTDFIGAQFSGSLAWQSSLMMGLTLLAIWIYATIRFKWDFALGAVFAIIHDALIMVAFIVWFGLELNATMVAAILTIIGYSINDTVVVLDRVRENTKILKIKKFKDVLDISQTETLGRTIITTVTTLLAVFALYFFTDGAMKEFALALIVGMLSGVYSTIFIASGFIAFVRRNWKASEEEKKTQVIDIEL